jgi:hypothetical protein
MKTSAIFSGNSLISAKVFPAQWTIQAPPANKLTGNLGGSLSSKAIRVTSLPVIETSPQGFS